MEKALNIPYPIAPGKYYTFVQHVCLFGSKALIGNAFDISEAKWVCQQRSFDGSASRAHGKKKGSMCKGIHKRIKQTEKCFSNNESEIESYYLQPTF
jgi:hypothetical protein